MAQLNNKARNPALGGLRGLYPGASERNCPACWQTACRVLNWQPKCMVCGQGWEIQVMQSEAIDVALISRV